MAHLSPDDVVPALHQNVTFSDLPHGLGTGFLSVKNYLTGEDTYLRGFECSLARMLDGRRTARQMVDAAERVGLPLTLDDLDAFLKKLADRRLVGEQVRVPESIFASPWKVRRAWNPQTRELYRSALRKGRTGNIDLAVATLDVLLGDAPNIAEAVALRERLREERRASQPPPPFRAVFAQTERNWKLSAEAVEPAATPLSRARGKAGLIAAGASLMLATIALGGLIIPFPHQVTAAATLVPIATSRVAAPRSGTVSSVQVAVGQWVDQDDVLFTYDVTEELTQLEAAVGHLERLNEQLYSRLPKTPEARGARAAYDQAESRLARAQAALERARTGGPAAAVGVAEDTVNRALVSLAQAHQTLDSQVPPEQAQAIELQRSRVQALQRQLLDAEVKAPHAGAITMLAARPGVALSRGDETVQLDDTRKLKAIAHVKPSDQRAIAPGLPVLVLAGDRATSTYVTDTSGERVEVVVDNPGRMFEPGPAEVQIRGKAVPLL